MRDARDWLTPEIMFSILDDMFLIGEQMKSWTCRTYWAYGMHDQCHHTVHELRHPEREVGEIPCSCGRRFRTDRGLQIHKGRLRHE